MAVLCLVPSSPGDQSVSRVKSRIPSPLPRLLVFGTLSARGQPPRNVEGVVEDPAALSSPARSWNYRAAATTLVADEFAGKVSA